MAMNADYPAVRPPMPETPVDALGPLLREQVIVEERTFLIMRPSESDRLLDHPSVRSAFAADEYMPYWADLWPAARMLAKAILRETWPPGLCALEVGCGLGLPGIAAMAMGLHVTFSDYDSTALRFAAGNARANGLHSFATLQMDWRYPPENVQFPVILASDLIYEMRNVAPLSVDRSRPCAVACPAGHIDGRGFALHHQNHACRRTGRPASQGHAVPHHALGLSKRLSILQRLRYDLSDGEPAGLSRRDKPGGSLR
jgi:lysine methyltransferase